MSDRFVAALKRAYRILEEQEWIHGQIGKKIATGYVLHVPGRPNFVWVTLRIANGGQTVVPARNDASVKVVEKLSVKMKLESGNYVIYGKSGRQDIGANIPSPDSGVEAHPVSEHTDVIITTPVDNEILRYESTGSSWLNVALGSLIALFTSKSLLVGADQFVISDSETANSSKKVSWSDIVVGMLVEVGNYITGLAAKVTPVDADSVVITDSAAASVPKRVTFANFVTYIMAKITALTAKTTLVGADQIIINDSAAADVPKKITWTNLLTSLVTNALIWTANQAFNSTATSGSALSVTRNLDAASTDAPVVSIIQDHATDDQIALRVQQDGTGKLFAMFDGVTEVLSLLDGGKLDLTGPFRAFGTGTTPSATGGGPGVEYWFYTGAGGPYGLMLSFDRDAGTYQPARIAASSIGFEEGATRIMTIDGGNVGILVNPALTPLQVRVGTNQNLGVASVATQTTISAFNDTGAANVPLRIHGNPVLVYDGVAGYNLFITKTGIVGSEIEFIAASIVTKGIYARVFASGSGGTIDFGSITIAKPGAASTSVNTAGGLITLKLYSTGRLVVFRAAGAETWAVTLDIVYQ